MKAITLFFILGASLVFTQPHTAKLSPSDQQLLRFTIRGLALNFFSQKTSVLPKEIPRWGHETRDCAGFIRYLLWEAYQNHSARWHDIYGSHFTRELSPLRGRQPQLYNKEGAAKYIPARALAFNNARLLGRNVAHLPLRTGDFLLFQLKNGSYHVMVVVESSTGKEPLLVYHTGQPKNELRLISLNDLFENRATWHPIEGNTEFSGAYRFYFFD